MKGLVLLLLLCSVSAENVATLSSESESSAEKSATIESTSINTNPELSTVPVLAEPSLEKSSSEGQSSPLLEISSTEKLLLEDNNSAGSNILSENSGLSSHLDLKLEDTSSVSDGTTSQTEDDETSSLSESSSSKKSSDEGASVNLSTIPSDVSIEGEIQKPISEIQSSDPAVSKSSSSLTNPSESVTPLNDAKPPNSPSQVLSSDKSQFSPGKSSEDKVLPIDDMPTATLKEENPSASRDSDSSIKETFLTSGSPLAENSPLKSALPSPNYNISPQQLTGPGSEIKSPTEKCITEAHSKIGETSEATSKVSNMATSENSTPLQKLESIGSGASSIETSGVPSAAPIFIHDFSRAPGITPFYRERRPFLPQYTLGTTLQSDAYLRNGLPVYLPLSSGSTFPSETGLLPSPTSGNSPPAGHLLQYPAQAEPTSSPPAGHLLRYPVQAEPASSPSAEHLLRYAVQEDPASSPSAGHLPRYAVQTEPASSPPAERLIRYPVQAEPVSSPTAGHLLRYPVQAEPASSPSAEHLLRYAVQEEPASSPPAGHLLRYAVQTEPASSPSAGHLLRYPVQAEPVSSPPAGHLRYPVQAAPVSCQLQHQAAPISEIPSNKGLSYNWYREAQPFPVGAISGGHSIGDFTSGLHPNFPSQQFIL